jgi:hypothetical protein
MSRGRVRVTVLAASLTASLAAGTAWAAGMTLSSQQLGAASLGVPAFYPSSLVLANGTGAVVGRPDRRDTVTITYSTPLRVNTMCTGAAQGNLSLSSVTVALTSNGATSGNDALSVTGGPATCATPRLGTVDLGSPGYLASGSITFTGSTLAITVTSSSATVVLTLGTSTGNATTVSSATTGLYAPNSALTDTSARAIGGNLAATTSGVQW